MTLKLIKSLVVVFVLLIPTSAMAVKKKLRQQTDREYWCEQAYKMAQPVLENMAKGELQKNMLLEVSPNWDGRSKKVAYMECFGRLMAGIAPWLTLPDDDTAEGGRPLQAQSHQDAVHASGNDRERHLGDVCEQCQHVIQVSALAYVCYGFYGYGRKNVVGHHSRQF